MAQMKLYRGEKAAIPKTIEDGSVYLSTDTGTLYIDTPDTRYEFPSGIDIPDNAGYHNSIFRGKYLGDTVTDAQYDMISSGKFNDLYIGDYWTIDDTVYRIAAIDFYYNRQSCTTHHVVIVPDTLLKTNVYMNSTDTTSTGYSGSYMRTTGLTTVRTSISGIFGDHLLSLTKNFSTNGTSSAYSSYSSTVDLMTGSNLGLYHGAGMAADTDNIPYPLFQIAPQFIHLSGSKYWLRSIYDSSFVTVGLPNSNTLISKDSANSTYGVRPSFAIK